MPNKPHTLDEINEIIWDIVTESVSLGIDSRPGDLREKKMQEELGNRCAKELSALIDQEVKKARIDELNELNYQIAKNSWHKENAYKMYPYILDRIAELEKDNK